MSRPERLRILSVEDEPLNRLLLRAVLERSDDPRLRHADLIEAGTVAEGRRELAESSPDLVLLDQRLPDGEGLELARERLSDPNVQHPPFVVVTADAIPATRAAAVAAGCAALVVKPYQPSDLTALLARLLDSAASPPETHRPEAAGLRAQDGAAGWADGAQGGRACVGQLAE